MQYVHVTATLHHGVSLGAHYFRLDAPPVGVLWMVACGGGVVPLQPYYYPGFVGGWH